MCAPSMHPPGAARPIAARPCRIARARPGPSLLRDAKSRRLDALAVALRTAARPAEPRAIGELVLAARAARGLDDQLTAIGFERSLQMLEMLGDLLVRDPAEARQLERRQRAATGQRRP